MSAVSPPAPHPALTADALAAIYEHARREHPNELHAEDPVKHARDARTAYNLGAGDLFKLGKSLRGDEPAKIVYHSHVDVERADGAYFSETDQAAATMDGEPSYPVEYVVVDIRRDGVRGAAQFAWDASERRYLEIGRYPAPRAQREQQ